MGLLNRMRGNVLPKDAAAPADAPSGMAVLAAEAWRFDGVVRTTLQRMEPGEARRFAGQYNWFRRKVDEAVVQAGIETVDLTGKPWSAGLPVTPLNAEDFGDEPLVIAQMIEPIVMQGGKVIKTGTVMLERTDA